METRAIIEIVLGFVLFVVGFIMGYVKKNKNKGIRDSTLSMKQYFNGMELVGISKDQPIPPQRENLYRLELFCELCKLWNAYESDELIPVTGDITLGCCASKILTINEGRRKVNISDDRRAYLVTPAMIVYKQFNNES